MDNGIGIPKEHLEKIWYVFYRVDNRHVPGDGIGLSVVKRIVEKHHGKIWVESTERYGTTFFIELPVDVFTEN
jgi:signal transduction histidine kinase